MNISGKFLSIAVTLALMSSFWSCQREEEPSPVVEEEVAFMVSTGEVQTKAIADGSNIDILYYEVYGSDIETAAEPMYEGSVKDVSDGKFVLNISLVKNVTYHFVFWAQVDGAGHYDVTNLRKVKIADYADEKANDETRAAFFAYEKITVTGQADRSRNVILKRPFSQINVGTSTYATSVASLNVSASKMTVTNIADTFNTLSGQGEGATTVTFDSAPTPNGSKDLTDKLLETKDADYYWLGMNYVIVCGDQDNVTVDAYFTTDKGEVHVNVPNVNIKENHRTNIVGNLLTTHTVFNIVVDELFIKPDHDYDDEGNPLKI